jgi:hypothetical protein
MTDQLLEEERLRIQRSEFRVLLGTLPQDDPRRQPLNRKLRENTEQFRQLIVDRAMDPCAQLDCIEEGTVTHDEKQWCLRHAAHRASHQNSLPPGQ